MGATSGAGIGYPSGAPVFTPGFSGVRVTSCFICMFCRSLFVLLFFFFWPLCCLFFLDIRILITPLVSLYSLLYNYLFGSTWDQPGYMLRGTCCSSFLFFCVVPLLTDIIPSCDVRYDFCINTMFVSSLPKVVCRRVLAYLRYL
jgi:hypothetical protein